MSEYLSAPHEKQKSPLSLLEQVARVNTERKLPWHAVLRARQGSAAARAIAVLGVTFKPNTDDMREPSLVIVPMLQAKGARVRACDPHGRANAERLLPGVEWCDNAFETAERSGRSRPTKRVE
jgi:UDPglucose 6-dehydrogenase